MSRCALRLQAKRSSVLWMGFVALGLLAAVPAGAAEPLGACRVELRSDAEAIARGEPLVLSLHSECAGGLNPGVALEVSQDEGGSARSIATLRDVTLGGAPSAFRIEVAEISCYTVRATRGDETLSARACLEAVALEIPAAPLHTARRGAMPGESGLSECRVLGLASVPGPHFAVGDALALSASFVCPAAVPRVRVSLLRHGRSDAAEPLATAIGVAFHKGRTVVALPGADLRATTECLRVQAERAGQVIEAQTCVRPASLRLAPSPALHALVEGNR